MADAAPETKPLAPTPKLDADLAEEQKKLQLDKLRRARDRVSAPWWRRAGTITVLTTIMAAVWPAANFVSGLTDKWKADSLQDRQWIETVRTGYLDRLHAAATLPNGLQDSLAISQHRIDIWKEHATILRFVIETSSDPKLIAWAKSESGVVDNAIKQEEEARKHDQSAAQTALALNTKLDEKQIASESRQSVAKGRTGESPPPDPASAKQIAALKTQIAALRDQYARDRSAAEAARATVSLPVGLEARGTSGFRASILWVDDNPDNNTEIAEILEANGAIVTLSTSTEDAERRLISAADRRRQYDLVISDMRRPPDVQAGYTLLAWMQERKLNLPFLIYSAGGSAPERQREARDRHADGITNDSAELIRMIERSVPGFRISTYASR